MLKVLKILLRPYALTWVPWYFLSAVASTLAAEHFDKYLWDTGWQTGAFFAPINYMFVNVLISWAARYELAASLLKFYAISFYSLQILFVMAIIIGLCWDGGNLASIPSRVWWETFVAWLWFSLAAFFLSSLMAVIGCVARR